MTYDEKNLEKLPAKGILSDRWGSWARNPPDRRSNNLGFRVTLVLLGK
jgi:hypothetical protein